MKFDITDIKKPLVIDLYQNMLKSRMIEEKMITLLRQGKISKWFSGIGQEAISTALTMHVPDVGQVKTEVTAVFAKENVSFLY